MTSGLACVFERFGAIPFLEVEPEVMSGKAIRFSEKVYLVGSKLEFSLSVEDALFLGEEPVAILVNPVEVAEFLTKSIRVLGVTIGFDRSLFVLDSENKIVFFIAEDVFSGISENDPNYSGT